VHPVEAVVDGERPGPGGIAGEVGVVEEVAPLAAGAAAEGRSGVDPVVRTAAMVSSARARIDSNDVAWTKPGQRLS
jgi:hypothetical protein